MQATSSPICCGVIMNSGIDSVPSRWINLFFAEELRQLVGVARLRQLAPQRRGGIGAEAGRADGVALAHCASAQVCRARRRRPRRPPGRRRLGGERAQAAAKQQGMCGQIS